MWELLLHELTKHERWNSVARSWLTATTDSSGERARFFRIRTLPVTQKHPVTGFTKYGKVNAVSEMMHTWRTQPWGHSVQSEPNGIKSRRCQIQSFFWACLSKICLCQKIVPFCVFKSRVNLPQSVGLIFQNSYYNPMLLYYIGLIPLLRHTKLHSNPNAPVHVHVLVLQ